MFKDHVPVTENVLPRNGRAEWQWSQELQIQHWHSFLEVF